jgi:hypothetical protein
MTDDAARLAGFIAAHSVWSVSDGQALVPIVGRLSGEGKVSFTRHPAETFEAAAESAIAARSAKHDGEVASCVAIDGYTELSTGATDAVIISASDAEHPDGDLVLAIPYRPAKLGFAVHTVKVISAPESYGSEVKPTMDAFFEGVRTHAQGNSTWSAHAEELS